MSEPRGYVVVGSDTEVGKTTIACGIVRRLVERGVRVGVFKPAASGLDGSAEDDIERLRTAAGGRYSVEDICPYRFAEPLAPLLAARKLGVAIEWDAIAAALDAWQRRCDTLVVETAGGLYSPLDVQHSNLDFAEYLRLPAVAVVPNRLGAINAALLVCGTLLQRRVPIAAVIFNDVPQDTCSEELRRTNLELFAELHVAYLRCRDPLPTRRIGVGGAERLELGSSSAATP